MFRVEGAVYRFQERACIDTNDRKGESPKKGTEHELHRGFIGSSGLLE